MAVPSEISSSWSIAQSWGHRDEMSARFSADVCGQWGELHHTARPLRVSDPDGAVPERPRSPYVRCSMCPTRPAMAWEERGMPSHLIRARTHRIGAVACDGRHSMTLLNDLPSSWPGCDITVWQLGLRPGAWHRAPAADLPAEDRANSRLWCTNSEPGDLRIRNQCSLAFVVTLAWARLARLDSGRLLATHHRHAEGATTEMRLDGSRHHYHPRPTCVYLPRFPIW